MRVFIEVLRNNKLPSSLHNGLPHRSLGHHLLKLSVLGGVLLVVLDLHCRLHEVDLLEHADVLIYLLLQLNFPIYIIE